MHLNILALLMRPPDHIGNVITNNLIYARSKW